MSIIQEALKKIDLPASAAPPAAPARPAIPNPAGSRAAQRVARPVLPPRPDRVTAALNRHAIPVTALVVCAACAIALALIGGRAFTAKKPAPAAAEPAPLPPPHQETIYKTVDTAAAATVVRSAPPDLRLDGIMYLDSGPRAIINNAIVGEGDAVSGATVSAINKKSVILTYNNVEITLNLK